MSGQLIVDLVLMSVSSFILFFAMTLLMEFFLYVFQVRSPRIRAFYRFLPIAKLPFDLVFHELYPSSLFNLLNPVSCHSYLQQWIIGQFSDNAQTIHTLTHYLAHAIPSQWLKVFLSAVMSVSFWVMARTIIQFFRSIVYLKGICTTAEPCSRIVFSQSLQETLQRTRALLLTSKEVTIPISIHNGTILFPQSLVQELSQSEFEAVIAHELEHLRWRDPLIKLSANVICSFFWWIPTRWWLNKLENEQELACDLCVNRYGIDRYALATAIYKVVAQAKAVHLPLIHCSLANSLPLKRLQTLLETKGPSQVHLRMHCAIGAALAMFLLMSFWIC